MAKIEGYLFMTSELEKRAEAYAKKIIAQCAVLSDARTFLAGGKAVLEFARGNLWYESPNPKDLAKEALIYLKDLEKFVEGEK